MSFFERLTSIIEERGLTIRKVERDCGLANASIRRWETQSPRLESVAAVANYLQVSVDYLALGHSENTTREGPVCDGIPLSQAEADFVAMFRYLKEHDRETAFDFVTMLYEKATGEKGSIYSTYIEDEREQKSDPAEGREAQGGIA